MCHILKAVDVTYLGIVYNQLLADKDRQATWRHGDMETCAGIATFWACVRQVITSLSREISALT